MGSWRKQNSDSYYRDMQGPRLMNRRPPPPSGARYPTVPSWEKKFCSSIGCVPWKKIMETKKFMYLYDNVIQWDNSAGEEAFNNAKKRFWAELNHLPCDLQLPDPELYIEDIDWETKVDPELILDLEREKEVREETVSMHEDPHLLDVPVPCTGWGDEEDYKPEDAVLSSDAKGGALDQDVDKNRNPWEGYGDRDNVHLRGSGWGGDLNSGHLQSNDGWGGDLNSRHAQGNDGWGGGSSGGHTQGNDGWGGDWRGWHVRGNDGWGGDRNGEHTQGDGWGRKLSDYHVQENGWRGDDWNNSWGWNQPEANHHERKANYGISNGFNVSGGYRGSWDRKDTGESPSCSMSRFKTSRFYGENQEGKRGGWSGRGKKRGNHVHERSFQDKNGNSRRWNCA